MFKVQQLTGTTLVCCTYQTPPCGTDIKSTSLTVASNSWGHQPSSTSWRTMMQNLGTRMKYIEQYYRCSISLPGCIGGAGYETTLQVAHLGPLNMYCMHAYIVQAQLARESELECTWHGIHTQSIRLRVENKLLSAVSIESLPVNWVRNAAAISVSNFCNCA